MTLTKAEAARYDALLNYDTRTLAEMIIQNERSLDRRRRRQPRQTTRCECDACQLARAKLREHQ